MQRRLFYTSRADPHDADAWLTLAAAFEKVAGAACARDVSVAIGDQPVFGPDLDNDEALLRVEEAVPPPRSVGIDRWCTYAEYGTICMTLGANISRGERRKLQRAVGKRGLAGHSLVREHLGPYDYQDAEVFAYKLPVDQEDARVTLRSLVLPLDTTCYIGERWLLQGDDEQLDSSAYNLMTEFGPGLAFFHAKNQDAEARIWQSCVRGEGLIALYPDDPDLDDIVRHFANRQDLGVLSRGRSYDLRVTVGRCRPEDSLVVVYQSVHAPEIDAPLAFVI